MDSQLKFNRLTLSNSPRWSFLLCGLGDQASLDITPAPLSAQSVDLSVSHHRGRRLGEGTDIWQSCS